MAEVLLFCIAPVASATIDQLLQAPKHSSFSLVRDPAQVELDLEPTRWPVAPFTSGFLDYSHEQIAEFVTTRLPTTSPGSNLDPNIYAVLDNASDSHHTVVIANCYSPLVMQDIDTMTEDEQETWQSALDAYDYDNRDDDLWRFWRVKFEDADALITDIEFESDYTPKLYRDDFVAAHTDANGIFHASDAKTAYLQHSLTLQSTNDDTCDV